MSKKAEKSDAKGKADKKDKKGKKSAGAGEGGALASVAGHPRARAQVRRAKGWGGLLGFGIAAYLSLKAGLPAADAGLRALGAGIVGRLVAWACAVAVWRHLVVAELRAAYEYAARYGRPPGKHGASGASGNSGASGATGAAGGSATGDRR